ncbi:MAG: HupE/UreJ family protein [Nannocystaceae bacterium]
MTPVVRRAGSVAALVLAWLMLAVGPAHAHEFRPASLSLRVDARGEVSLRFVPPPVTAAGPSSGALRPLAPAHCVERSAARWSCGAAGLTGELRIEGLAADPVDVLVHVQWADGHRLQARLGPDRPAMMLGRGEAVTGTLDASAAYFVLGGQHVLEGIDHLLFVLALLLLGGRPRDHLRTITAFTAGHTVALLLQTLTPLAVPGPWVEACITASIVVAAAEALRARPRRQTAWTWALAFGVIHGLGFAGALEQLGLPPDHRVVALLSFNVGVEAGQLAVVLGLLVLAAIGPRQPDRRDRTRRAIAFVVGTVAVAWTLERIVAF